MKQYRTTLLEDAESGSVRAAVHSRLPAAALRERLSQTRARIAQGHTTSSHQIDVDWDPDEPPTRVYQGQSLISPRALRASAARVENPLTAYAFAQFRARVSQRPAPAVVAPAARVRPRRDLSVTQRATAQLPKVEPAAHVAPVQERQTLPPLASRVLHEVTVVGERIGKLYEGFDRSDAALRRRVAYCSLALLVIAASSRMLFGGDSGHSGAAPVQEQPPSAKQTALPRLANVAISSDPPGAQIILNGRASSQVTPAKLTDLAPGRHMIGLKLAGYADAKEALHVPGDALVSIKLASLSEPRFAPEKSDERTTLTRAEQRAQARELARERRAAARAAKVLMRYRARMGLPPDPVAQELVEAYGPTQSAE